MEVHRINLDGLSHRYITTIPVLGVVRSNILEDDIAGCIVNGPSMFFYIHVVDWRTGLSAIINTGIKVCISIRSTS